MACAYWLPHFIAITWLCMAHYLHPCGCLSIDQIISQSMASPSGYGFMYDEASNIIKVDMDMIFSIDDWARITRLNDSYYYYGPYKRQAIKPGAGAEYWPGGIIYYEIADNDFNQNDLQQVYGAMNDWMRYTCVQFRYAYPNTVNKIRFVDGDGCSSHVGMVGETQKVTLAKGCRSKRVITHELGHVLGFHHEQTRPDRDYYVTIHKENIPDHLEYNFRKFTWAVIQNLGVPYDYLSIMHYGKEAFSNNGKDTIQTTDYRYQNVIGKRQALSFRDIKSANLLYNCRNSGGRTCQLLDQDCPGDGFVSKDCTCWCPTQDLHADPPYFVCQPGRYPIGNGPDPGNGGQYPGNGGTYPGNGNQGGTTCENQNDKCVVWASRGECQNNPSYMESYCRRACGLCGAVTSPCRDQYNSCSFWRERGFCSVTSSYSVFMTTACKQTCGFCQTSGGHYSSYSVMSQGSADALSGSVEDRGCADAESQGACDKWKKDGECDRSRDIMAAKCRRTCNLCGSSTQQSSWR